MGHFYVNFFWGPYLNSYALLSFSYIHISICVCANSQFSRTVCIYCKLLSIFQIIIFILFICLKNLCKKSANCFSKEKKNYLKITNLFVQKGYGTRKGRNLFVYGPIIDKKTNEKKIYRYNVINRGKCCINTININERMAQPRIFVSTPKLSRLKLLFQKGRKKSESTREEAEGREKNKTFWAGSIYFRSR